MLQSEGNYEGESPNIPGATSIIGNYPEAFSAARDYPMGRLQDFQRPRDVENRGGLRQRQLLFKVQNQHGTTGGRALSVA